MKCSLRLRVALALIVGFVAASSARAAEPKASKELLVGSWTGKVEIDEAALKADKQFKELPAEQADLILGLIKQQFVKMKMSMTFNDDGSATAEIDAPNIPATEKKKAGTWEVVKADGASISVKITPKVEEGKEASKKDKPQEMTFKFIDEKTMTASPGDDKAGGGFPDGVAFKFTKK